MRYFTLLLVALFSIPALATDFRLYEARAIVSSPDSHWVQINSISASGEVVGTTYDNQPWYWSGESTTGVVYLPLIPGDQPTIPVEVRGGVVAATGAGDTTSGYVHVAMSPGATWELIVGKEQPHQTKISYYRGQWAHDVREDGTLVGARPGGREPSQYADWYFTATTDPADYFEPGHYDNNLGGWVHPLPLWTELVPYGADYVVLRGNFDAGHLEVNPTWSVVHLDGTFTDVAAPATGEKLWPFDSDPPRVVLYEYGAPLGISKVWLWENGSYTNPVPSIIDNPYFFVVDVNNNVILGRGDIDTSPDPKARLYMPIVYDLNNNAEWVVLAVNTSTTQLLPKHLYDDGRILATGAYTVFELTPLNFGQPIAPPEPECNKPTGDANGDGQVNAFDTDAFSFAIANGSVSTGEETFLSQYPDGCWCCCDINKDGAINMFDLDPFVLLISQ